jgi:hypothetical protein
MLKITIKLCTVLMLYSTVAHAHDYKAKAIRIDHPYATTSPTNSKTGMVFFRSIENQSKENDTLLQVSTPITKQAYLFNPLGYTTISIEARSKQNWRHDKAGAPHIMLEGLQKPLKAGEKFPLTLVFQKAGTVKVSVWVQEPKTKTAHQH